MVGTHSQVGCSPPQTGSPCCVRCPPGARGEAGCHRLCPPRLPFSLSHLRVSPRHRLQVGSPASLWVRLSLHLLLFSVLLPPPLLSLSLCGLLCLSLPTPGASPMDISGTTLPNPTSDPLLWPQSPAQSHMPGTRGGQETGVGLGQGGWGLHCGGCRRQRAAGPFPVTLRVGWGRPLQRFACRQWPPPPRGLPGGAFLSPPWNVWRDGLGSPGDRRAQDGSELSKPRRPPNLLLLSSRTCFVHFRNPGPPEVCLEVGSAAPPARPLGLLGKALGLWSRGAAQGQR